MMTVTQTRTDAGLATALRISVSRLARRLAELTTEERATLRAAVPILEKLSQSS